MMLKKRIYRRAKECQKMWEKEEVGEEEML